MNIKTINTFGSLFALAAAALVLNTLLFSIMYLVARYQKPLPEPLITLSLADIQMNPTKKKAAVTKKPVPKKKKTKVKKKKRLKKPMVKQPIKRKQAQAKPVESPSVPLNTPEKTLSEPQPPQVAEEDLPEPVPVFKLTQLPRFLHKQEPEYPQEMIHLGKEVLLKLSVLVDTQGKVRMVEIIKSGGDLFDRSARRALMASTFIPAKLKGKAVPSRILLPVKFKLL